MDEKFVKLQEQAEKWVEAHKEEFITELQGMTRIPSISRADLAQEGAPFGPDCRKMLDYAMERGCHYDFQTMDHEGYAASICYGDPQDSIGVFAHLDVVPVGEGWIYPPFEALYLPEHDAIVGRGCDDNKCAAVGSLFAMRMLREFGYPLKHGVRLFCGVSEETGMQDMIALKEKGFQFPKLNLVPDAGFPVNYGQKGSANGEISIECNGNLLAFEGGSATNAVPGTAECVLAMDTEACKDALQMLDAQLTSALEVTSCEEGTKIRATGKAAHTAKPEDGINAIYLLSRALVEAGLLNGSCADVMAQVYELSGDFTGKNEGVSYGDEMSGNLTLVYAMAELREGRLFLKANSRTPLTCDVEILVENLKNAWTQRGFEVVGTSFSKPYYVPVDDPHVEALQEIYRSVTKLDKPPFVMSGGNYARVIPNAYSFGPGTASGKPISAFMPQGHGNCHGADEAVYMEKAHICAITYVLAIAKMDEMLD